MSSEIQKQIEKEAKRRRTFAIISHPDAGKTTLTEKLLLYGGAIHLAGQVKARRKEKSTTSDWMEIEKERGISVTSSVLQFEYQGFEINLLDTPGHKDFSEDTYRTLTAADAAVMLIDNAKGVEPQTRKLFEVCRMRGIPIFTFVNKMDREGREPLELLDEIEEVLGIRSCPRSWPLGMGRRFKGVLDLEDQRVLLYEPGSNSEKRGEAVTGVNDPKLEALMGEDDYRVFKEEAELISTAGEPFDHAKILKGELTPVFFGSAMTNFGVRHFLETFIRLAPAPSGRPSTRGEISPFDPKFSSFVFKIQANMDPQHRDRVAFVRICSGKFTRGMDVRHSRMEKPLRLNKSLQFMANERVAVEVAWPGDIVGMFDTSGALRIGDTLCEGAPFEFDGIPRFSPEYFVRVNLKDPLKRKQLKKGLDQLSEEGVVQVFSLPGLGDKDPILGAVGALQFEVLAHRLKSEYSVEVVLEKMPFVHCRWAKRKGEEGKAADSGKSSASAETSISTLQRVLSGKDDCKILEDRDALPILLFKNDWSLQWAQTNLKDFDLLTAAPAVRK